MLDILCSALLSAVARDPALRLLVVAIRRITSLPHREQLFGTLLLTACGVAGYYILVYLRDARLRRLADARVRTIVRLSKTIEDWELWEDIEEDEREERYRRMAWESRYYGSFAATARCYRHLKSRFMFPKKETVANISTIRHEAEKYLRKLGYNTADVAKSVVTATMAAFLPSGDEQIASVMVDTARYKQARDVCFHLPE